ncbi:hypothetical protein BD410DRAFT_842837 [Rickenella mellea]|uniref:Zn(2)-C6 fungal-type domain-containing protein n=1 Tax=Rickenella mellea TaxID=50990 RepID=A0A4Y7PVH7_9AGAM|nr:hypothetical protein BD410DRAFT_842837 [Rickenella mellea]
MSAQQQFTTDFQHHPPYPPSELPVPRKRPESNRKPCQQCSNNKVKHRCVPQPDDPKCVRCTQRGLPCTPYRPKPRSPKQVKRQNINLNAKDPLPPEVLAFVTDASPRNVGQSNPPPPATRVTTSNFLLNGHPSRFYPHCLQSQVALNTNINASPRDTSFPLAPPFYLPAVVQPGGAANTPAGGWGEDAQVFPNSPPFAAFPPSRQTQVWTRPQMNQQDSGFSSEEHGFTSQYPFYHDTSAQFDGQVQPKYTDSSTAAFTLICEHNIRKLTDVLLHGNDGGTKEIQTR